MGFLATAKRALAEARVRLLTGGVDDSSPWITGAARTAAGPYVTTDVALTYSAVWAAVGLISETVAVLPVEAKRIRGEAFEFVAVHPALSLFNTAPNPEQNPFAFRELLTARALLWGNGTAEIQRNDRGDAARLWPIHPSRLHPVRRNGELFYEVDNANNYNDPARPGDGLIAHRDLFNCRFKGDGIWGQSIISYARESIGLGLGAETYGASLFGNKATPGGLIEYPGKLSPKQIREAYDEWSDTEGPANAHKIKILTGGATWKATGMPPDDAQFLETRKFQVSEVARWFGVPPHLLADLDKATFSNIEEQGLEFVRRLAPWFARWEQEAETKLVSAAEFGRVKIDHRVAELLRADISKRGAWYAQMRQWGVYSVNDIRRAERLPEVEGGDARLEPANMHPLGDPPEADQPDQADPAAGGPGDSPGFDDVTAARFHTLAHAGVLLRDAFERMLAKESAEVAKLADGPRFLDRLGRFFDRAEPKLAAALAPVRQILGPIGVAYDPAAAARDYRSKGIESWLDWSGTVRASAGDLADQAKLRAAWRTEQVLAEVATDHAIRSQETAASDRAAA